MKQSFLIVGLACIAFCMQASHSFRSSYEQQQALQHRLDEISVMLASTQDPKLIQMLLAEFDNLVLAQELLDEEVARAGQLPKEPKNIVHQPAQLQKLLEEMLDILSLEEMKRYRQLSQGLSKASAKQAKFRPSSPPAATLVPVSEPKLAAKGSVINPSVRAKEVEDFWDLLSQEEIENDRQARQQLNIARQAKFDQVSASRTLPPAATTTLPKISKGQPWQWLYNPAEISQNDRLLLQDEDATCAICQESVPEILQVPLNSVGITQCCAQLICKNCFDRYISAKTKYLDDWTTPLRIQQLMDAGEEAPKLAELAEQKKKGTYPYPCPLCRAEPFICKEISVKRNVSH